MPTVPPSFRADALGEALNFLRMSETAYYQSTLTAPWGLMMPETCPKFHFITTGACWLQTDGEEDRRLEAGDFVIIPHGRGHRLASAPTARTMDYAELSCERISRRYAVFRRDGTGPVTGIICGDLDFKHPAAEHLVSHLPAIMHIRAAANHSLEWLHGTIQFMAVESRELRPGSEAIITRLADVLVIQAIRYWIEQNPFELSGWLAALEDSQISRALGLVHREPEKNWTIARLADAVAMSRSAFAARFSQLVGEPVMRYVTRWRMHLAQDHLRKNAKTVEEIADLLGYQSASAFSRAFKRSYGIWPGAVKITATGADKTTASAHRYIKLQTPSRRVGVA